MLKVFVAQGVAEDRIFMKPFRGPGKDAIFVMELQNHLILKMKGFVYAEDKEY